MSTRSLDNLLTDAQNTFDRIEKLPKDRITPDLETEISNWKSQITSACLPLILETSRTMQFYSFDTSSSDKFFDTPSSDKFFGTPSSDYSIDLRATSHILPRRLEGKLNQIDEITKTNRTRHEAEIGRGNIICYRATLDGKLVAFKSSSSSPANEYSEILSFVLQLLHFNFPKLPIKVTSTYDITYCAHPNCDKRVKGEEDHLQLCHVHGKQLLENIDRRWLSAESKHIYNDIKNAGERDSAGIHRRIYYQLLQQLDLWIRQIDHIIPSDYTGVETSSIDTWLILQLRPVRLLLTLMKSAIFVYRMHLNQAITIIASIIALITVALRAPEVIQAMANGFVRVIRTVCGVIATIFAYVGIGILYTLDLIFSDDAYIAIILQTAGLGLVTIGGVMIGTGVASIAFMGAATTSLVIMAPVAAPIAIIIGGIWCRYGWLNIFFHWKANARRTRCPWTTACSTYSSTS